MERKEALEVVRKNMPTDRSLPVYEALQTLIPELRESEDKMTSERAIAILKQQRDFWSYDGPKDKSRPLTLRKDLVAAFDVALSCLEKQKEHQFYSDAPKEKSVGGDFLSSHKDKDLDEIAQDYVDGVKEYNPEPTWDLIQTAVCYGYHYCEQKEQKPVDIDYISGIREELLSIENNAKDIDGLTESQWVAIRAAHRLLGKYIEQEQKPAEWSYPYGRNETADRLVSLAECLEMDGDCLFNGYSGTECGKFLRELARKQVECKPEDRFEEAREKYQVEWSEEDEIKRGVIIRLVEQNSGWPYRAIKEYVNWLKSLRPSWKPSEVCYGAKGYPDPAGVWKPSKEQMEALNALNCHGDLSYVGQQNQLISLYNDLKKLKWGVAPMKEVDE